MPFLNQKMLMLFSGFFKIFKKPQEVVSRRRDAL